MNKVTGRALVIVGAGLFYFGWRAHESVVSTVSEQVTGAPSDRSLWLLGLGVLCASSGIYALLFRPVG